MLSTLCSQFQWFAAPTKKRKNSTELYADLVVLITGYLFVLMKVLYIVLKRVSRKLQVHGGAPGYILGCFGLFRAILSYSGQVNSDLFWAGQFRLLWPVSYHFGLFQKDPKFHMSCYRPFWIVSDYFKLLWIVLGLFWTIWTIFDCFQPFPIILKHSQIIPNHSHFRPFCTVKGCFGLVQVVTSRFGPFR
jgi:hypothetical protein